jgi:hypothetical protein
VPATSVKQQLAEILDATQFGAKRANKMNEMDFLELLSIMNKAGFHFTA